METFALIQIQQHSMKQWISTKGFQHTWEKSGKDSTKKSVALLTRKGGRAKR